MFVLFNLLFCSSCSTPVFSLFDISAPLARHWCSSYLTLLFRSSCSTYYSYSMLLFILFNAIAPCSFRYLSTTPMILLFFVIFAQCCNSCSSCFRLVFPPFFFPIFFVDEFFNYPCFWEIVVGNVFVYYVQELF